MPELKVSQENWPIRGTFAISRGSKTAADVVVVELSANGATGRGECVPYARYGETMEGVLAAVEGQREALAGGLDRVGLQLALPPGAARNALDCAFWDLEAKQAGHRVWELLGLGSLQPVTSVYTLSLDTPEAMGKAAAEQANRPVLKLKLAGGPDLERVSAVRANAPRSKIVVDANEGWTVADYATLVPALTALGVAMIEQPFPAGQDAALTSLQRPVPVCADESCHDTESLAELAGRYDMINIKLDKTGGLTEALRLKTAAEGQGFGIMIGCMIATSLAMAPAILVAQGAEVVDLDGPLLLAKDRPDGLTVTDSVMQPPAVGLWG